MSKNIKPALGKGLGALIPKVDYQKQQIEAEKSKSVDTGSIANIEIKFITTNPYQPRKDFDEEALNDLKNSILEHGVIQPITVRKSLHGFELVSGERRLRASKMAGLETIPAYVLDVETGAKSLQLAIIENVQRENLNPIEIAHSYQRLIDECNLTQEQVSVKVGKERSTVANFLRLLKLPEKVQELVRKKELSMGHARTLLGLSSSEKMNDAAMLVIDKQLSVRATEALVKELENTQKVAKPEPKQKEPIVSEETKLILEDLENRLRQSFATDVKIHAKSKQSGTISFEFYSPEDMERLIELFEEISKKNGN
jgi:ParB family chromosome partitioning protein